MNKTQEYYIVEALICLLKLHLTDHDLSDPDILKARNSYIRSTVTLLEALKGSDDED